MPAQPRQYPWEVAAQNRAAGAHIVIGSVPLEPGVWCFTPDLH